MDQGSMTSGWYYAKAGAEAGQELGPLSWNELYSLAQAGTLDPTDIVWNPRLPRGMAAGMLPELFPGIQTPPSPTITESLAPALTEPQIPMPTREFSPEEPKVKGNAGNRMPLVVLLVVAVVAAAGLTAYFLYFRDIDATSSGSEGLMSHLAISQSTQGGFSPLA